MHVLIVEHEPDAMRLANELKGHGIACSTAPDLESAWTTLVERPVPTDVIVLDVMLPDESARDLEWTRDIRAAGFLQPILVLVHRDDVDLRVRALAYAEDVLTLPCPLRELEAHLRALRRRGDVHPETVRWRDVVILIHEHAVYRGDSPVRLTAKEHELVELLVVNPGRVFPRVAILERLWGNGFEAHSNLVDVYVKNLRAKLGCAFIETIRGLGYRFPG